jgi:leucyl-tRNA synthetase
MKPYDHKKIEKKWQKIWEQKKLYNAQDPKGPSKKPKFYSLIEFPFPSGDGMHAGHLRSNTAMDIISRKRRAEGYNVIYPMGWDAFGLPTENYAIKTGLHPKIVTKKNTDNFRRQLKSAGFSFDWSREVNTSDPNYYKWTQWIFLQFYKHGLAYKKKMEVNWCPKDKIVLANEEVIDGACERCGTKVERREKEQWMLAITKYADRLDKDLDTVDYLDRIKVQQRNWIGKSQGAEIEFKIKHTDKKIKVFTTRPDTLFGVTYMVLAPEHALVNELLHDKEKIIRNASEVEKYTEDVKKKTETERTGEGREKTGVRLEGVMAINPANNELIPVFIADYVLAHYGTGAIMAVPGHDERDYQFAKRYHLPVIEVVASHFVDPDSLPVKGKAFQRRNNVRAIIKHWSEDKYLCIKWKPEYYGGRTFFVTGGVENKEHIVDSAMREIREETGYQNIEFVKEVPGVSHAEYYAQHKDVNRYAIVKALVFKLKDGAHAEKSEEDKKLHDNVWVDRKDLKKTVSGAEVGFFIDRYFEGFKPYTGAGELINSGHFDGQWSENAKKKITQKVDGTSITTYKLRDWIFSRQRYWGEPIPMVYCKQCEKDNGSGWVSVPEKDLPVKLPDIKNYVPTDTGESPLAKVESWVKTKCPVCGGPARRETDTMPNWAGSSWYFLRYADPANKKALADKNKLKYWMPVDWYNGGMEHTTLHLLYSRFWNKFLFDIR